MKSWVGWPAWPGQPGWGGGHRIVGCRASPVLHDQEVETVEVDRPNRQARRKVGKSDPIDVEAA